MQSLENAAITAVPGFRAAGVHCGLKPTGDRDLALIYSEAPCRAAAVFTRNRVKAAPVLYDQAVLASNCKTIQAVAAGAGISLVSLWAAGPYLESGRISALRLKGPELSRQFYYVLLRRRPATAAASALLRLLQEEKPRLEKKLQSISP